MAAAPAIEAIGISRSFGGVRALHEAAFEAGFGEIHALVGENGAGKSTLIKIMCGVLRPDAGTLRLRGEDLQLNGPADAQARGIGTVFQNQADSFFTDFTDSGPNATVKLCVGAALTGKPCPGSLDVKLPG